MLLALLKPGSVVRIALERRDAPARAPLSSTLMSRHHPSLDDSAFAPLQSLHQILNTDGFSQPFCVLARLQRHLDEGASSKGKDKEGELEWVVAVGMALEGGKREQWWSRVFTREELEMTADVSAALCAWEGTGADAVGVRVDYELGGAGERDVCAD